MKSTKWIKERLENTKKRIAKLESEMDEKGITYEESGNVYKHEPKPKEYYSGTTYKEAMGTLVTQKILLEEILRS